MTSEQILGLVVKARDEASQVLDQVSGKISGFSSKNRAAMGAVGAAIGGGAGAALGILGERTIAADNAMAQLRAGTGATATEAAALKDEMIALSRGTLDSQESIGATMEALIALQGLEAENTGQVGEMTAAYLEYARATGQDAATAVADFDDILDGFHMDAEEGVNVMDALVTSHQRFGTDVAGSQAALAKLAPTLTSLNMGVDDGIGILNLFAASGVDAGSAMGAMNKAVAALTDSSDAGKKSQAELATTFGLTKDETQAFLDLDPGAKFQELVKRISEMEDPASRAEASMALFGSRGGAAMAAALGNASEGLDSFKVSLDDSAGSTMAAADIIEGTMSNRLAILKNNVLGAAQSFSSDFGPALTAFGTMGPMVSGAIGSISGALPALGLGFKGVATTIGTALLTPPVGVLVAIVTALFLLYQAWDNNFLGIRDKTQAFLSWIDEKLGPFDEWFIGAFQAIWDWLLENWPVVLEAITLPFTPLVALASSAFGMVDPLIAAWTYIKDSATAIFGAVGGAIRGALNTAIGYVNSFVDRVNSLKIRIQLPELLGGGIFEWGGFNLPRVPFLAAGGVVSGPTLAMIGEGRGPEAVVPLDRSGEFAQFLRQNTGKSSAPSVIIDLRGAHLTGSLEENRRLMESVANKAIQRQLGRGAFLAGVS